MLCVEMRIIMKYTTRGVCSRSIGRRVEKDVKTGDIILMHDIFPTSVEAALRIVDDLQKQGYEFVTVEELLVD